MKLYIFEDRLLTAAQMQDEVDYCCDPLCAACYEVEGDVITSLGWKDFAPDYEGLIGRNLHKSVVMVSKTGKEHRIRVGDLVTYHFCMEEVKTYDGMVVDIQNGHPLVVTTDCHRWYICPGELVESESAPIRVEIGS